MSVFLPFILSVIIGCKRYAGITCCPISCYEEAARHTGFRVPRWQTDRILPYCNPAPFLCRTDIVCRGASAGAKLLAADSVSSRSHQIYCAIAIHRQDTFAGYYAKKHKEDKLYRVALVHTAKNLLRVIYTLQSKNVSYNPDLIR